MRREIPIGANRHKTATPVETDSIYFKPSNSRTHYNSEARYESTKSSYQSHMRETNNVCLKTDLLQQTELAFNTMN